MLKSGISLSSETLRMSRPCKKSCTQSRSPRTCSFTQDRGTDSRSLRTYSGSRLRCAQSGMSEPTEDILVSDLAQPLGDGVIQVLLRPRPDPTQEPLELREHLLDRRVIRAIGRQRQHPRSGSLDRL